MLNIALTGVAQCIGHHPAKHKVIGLVPDQGTYPGCRPGPQFGERGNQ